jgi:hypothetical protein
MLGFLRGCAGGQHDGCSGNRREYRFAWIPHDTSPPWFDFSQSNHQGDKIVNKVSELSAAMGYIAGQSAQIIDNSSSTQG